MGEDKLTLLRLPLAIFRLILDLVCTFALAVVLLALLIWA